MKDILETVEQWLSENKPVALATVASTWGSSPRQAGAKMAVTPPMTMIGSVSGGCVESAVLSEAVDSLKDGKPRLLNYGVSDDSAWSVGLACGGKISVYVEPLDKSWWQAAAGAVRHNRAAVTVTVLEGEFAGCKVFYDAQNELTYGHVELGKAKHALVQIAENAIGHRRKTSRETIGELDVLIDVHRPNPRLVIIGGAHVTQVLCGLAQMIGFEVIVIDPRSAFATPERFPAVKLLSHQYPDKVLPTLDLDSETYIAVLTHDPKIDDPALQVALQSAASYIGVMSSKRAHAVRIERLTKAGVDPKLIERIHTPIGLAIGAQSPEEIALSIMAEIVAVRNKNTE